MTPATALGMAIAFAATAPFSHFGGVSGGDIFLLAALGAGQIALGLILFTAGARLIPGRAGRADHAASRSCSARSGCG